MRREIKRKDLNVGRGTYGVIKRRRGVKDEEEKRIRMKRGGVER